MPFVIRHDESDNVATTARLAKDALVIARDLAAQGRSNVRVTMPTGDTFEVEVFARLLRAGES